MGQEYTAPESSGNRDEATAGEPLRIDILSVHPEMFAGPFDASILRRGIAAGLLDIRVHDLRDWTHDRHRSTDDYAYGGGGGMVMKPEPVFEAVESLLDMPAGSAASPARPPCPVLLLTPQGRRFDDACARRLARASRLVLICGHYEGFDERIRLHLATEELSVGDYVLTGGEIPAMLVTDAVARLRPGVVGHAEATASDSFADGLLEHPHYTRPADFRGWSVPPVLLSGHHGQVERWRRRESLRRTLRRRPDRVDASRLDAEQLAWLAELRDASDAPVPQPSRRGACE